MIDFEWLVEDETRSIPTLASNSNCVCSIGLGGSGVQTDTRTDTIFPIRRKPE